MSKNQLKKFNHACIDAYILELDISNHLKKTLNCAQTDMGIIMALMNEQDYANTMKFITFGLPIQERVWWGYLAAKQADVNAPPDVQCALQNIEEWVRAPSQVQYKFNAMCLQKLNPDTATYWSANSLESGQKLLDNPPTEETLNPEEISQTLCVCNALTLYSKMNNELSKHLVRQGLHIAMGGNGCV